MIILNLLPAGVLQLADVVKNGYGHARSLEFTMTGFFHTSEWVRMVGDLTFILVGVVPLVIGTIRGVWLARIPRGHARASAAPTVAATTPLPAE
jgi:nitric oxide reductase subunit B